MQRLKKEESNAEVKTKLKLKLSTSRFKILQYLQGGIKYDFREVKKQQASTTCKGSFF